MIIPTSLAGALPHDPHWAIHEPSARQILQNLSLAGSSMTRDEQRRGYVLDQGVALIQLSGPMTKQPALCAEGTSTIDVRRAARLAAADPLVRSIVLFMDTPGGTVSGTDDLAADIAAISKQKKTVAYVSDLCASAGYWVASQASEIWANPSALVGSIGTYMVVEDSSALAESIGVKVHVVRAGDHKGAGIPGTPVTDDQLEDFQRVVDGLNSLFLGAVASGRKMSPEQVAQLADGRVHLALDAKKLGLIDKIASFDDLISSLSTLAAPAATTPKARAQAGTSQEKSMTLKEKVKALFSGNPELAQAHGIDASDLDELDTVATPAAATVTATPAVPAASDPSAEFQAQLADLKAQNEQVAAQARAFAMSALDSAAKSFASLLIAESKAQPAQRAAIENAFRLAATADGGGTPAFSASGALAEGDNVAALRAVYKDAPQHQHGGDLIASKTATADADASLYAMTAIGRKALAAKQGAKN